MKKIILQISLIVVAFFLVVNVNAQFNYKKKATKDTVATKTAEVAPTTAVNTTSTSTNKPQIDSTIKSTKTVDTVMVGGFNANKIGRAHV